MANDGNGAVVTRSDGGGLKDLGDLCQDIEAQAREARYASADEDERDALEKIENVLDGASRLRLALRSYLATRVAVSDNRAST